MDSASSPPVDPIEAARAQSERGDTSLLDLIVQRLKLDDAIAQAKPLSGAPVRPAAEVKLLRRVLAEAGDRVEPELVVEIWRALIAANVRRQRPIDVVVGVGAGQDIVRYFDLARRHFGARTRIHRVEDARAALNRATDGETILAVVPWPNKTGSGMWWHILTESRYSRLKVIGALPMREGGGDPEAAICAASVPLEEAGGDYTFALAFDRHFKIARALIEANVKGEEVARTDNKVLIRLEGFLHPDDPRCGLLIRAGLDQFRVVGSFARV